MLKRMLIMLSVVIAVVAILGFIKFQQIQGYIASSKSFKAPPETVTTVVARSQIGRASCRERV